MTPDILILCLPIDGNRASAIPDALVGAGVTGRYRVRFLAVAAADMGWNEAMEMAERSPCTIFCWSDSTKDPASEAMRHLAEQRLAKGTAISVELDRGATPPSMAASTTYPLSGWRVRPGILLGFLFGNGFAADIAVAAQEKVIGRDPPPPSAYWRLIRRQAWIVGGALAFTLGILSSLWGIYRDPAVAKAVDREAAAAFLAAKQSRSCDGLRKFVRDHGGSAWSDEASELLATCVMRPVTTIQRVEQPVELFEMDERRLQADAGRKCKGAALTVQATLVATRIEAIDRTCHPGICARAICSLDQPVLEEREVMAGSN